MKQLGFIIDLNKCIGCRACEISCQNFNHLQDISLRHVHLLQNQPQPFHYLSLACNHCTNPECIRICPQHCFRKKRNGIVFLDSTHCDGCQKCLAACPFHAPKINPQTQRAVKCNFCYDALQQDFLPRCSTACPTGALQIGDIQRANANNYCLETPIVQYTKPSLLLFKPQKPLCFFRKG